MTDTFVGAGSMLDGSMGDGITADAGPFDASPGMSSPLEGATGRGVWATTNMSMTNTPVSNGVTVDGHAGHVATGDRCSVVVIDHLYLLLCSHFKVKSNGKSMQL